MRKGFRIQWGGEVHRRHRKEKRMTTISFALNLPPDIEEKLRAEDPDLSATVRETFAIDLFRRGILTHHGLAQTLGLDRFETDALLKRHRVTEQSLTHEDVDTDVTSLDQLLAHPRP
jgi:predicted HTH domain antitoxin